MICLYDCVRFVNIVLWFLADVLRILMKLHGVSMIILVLYVRLCFLKALLWFLINSYFVL